MSDNNQSQPARRGRLIGIDALRGVAALMVVVYHAIGKQPTNTASFWAILDAAVRYPLTFGYSGVYLFFVISGFCIHLQWAKRRAAGEDYHIDFWAFWRRRLGRLYPPYLIAMAAYLSLELWRGNLHWNGRWAWDIGLHVAMLHNLTRETCYSINGAFWTLAIEEQLYLSYFLLLFLRVRWGWQVVLPLCLVARVGWYLLFSRLRQQWGWQVPIGESAAAHWFTWSLGAMAVEHYLGLIKLPRFTAWPALAAIFLLAAIGLTVTLPQLHTAWIHDAGWLALDPLWGLGFFMLLCSCVTAEDRWQANVPTIVAHLATVGLFSYSLYLMHQFVLLHGFVLSLIAVPQLIFALVVMTPLAVIFAKLFFHYCERPFLPQSNRNAHPQLAVVKQ
jgi:peptidoglycan/LPS O-acetylase OafA/YrhL